MKYEMSDLLRHYTPEAQAELHRLWLEDQRMVEGEIAIRVAVMKLYELLGPEAQAEVDGAVARMQAFSRLLGFWSLVAE